MRCAKIENLVRQWSRYNTMPRTSERFWPTAGKSLITGIPTRSRSARAPMPDKFKIWGVLNAPAHNMTSLAAATRKRFDEADWANSTPIASVSSLSEKRTRVTWLLIATVRLGRRTTSLPRYAVAAEDRAPLESTAANQRSCMSILGKTDWMWAFEVLRWWTPLRYWYHWSLISVSLLIINHTTQRTVCVEDRNQSRLVRSALIFQLSSDSQFAKGLDFLGPHVSPLEIRHGA